MREFVLSPQSKNDRRSSAGWRPCALPLAGRGMRARGRGPARGPVYRKSGNRSAAPRAGRPGRRAGPRRMVAAALPWVRERSTGRALRRLQPQWPEYLIPDDRRMSGCPVRLSGAVGTIIYRTNYLSNYTTRTPAPRRAPPEARRPDRRRLREVTIALRGAPPARGHPGARPTRIDVEDT